MLETTWDFPMLVRVCGHLFLLLFVFSVIVLRTHCWFILKSGFQGSQPLIRCASVKICKNKRIHGSLFS